MEYTVIRTAEGNMSHCSCGTNNYSIKEYCGFCELCWLDLTSRDRAILKGLPEQPETKVVVSYKRSFLGIIWKLCITAVVILLLYHDGFLNKLITYLGKYYNG